MLDPFKVRRHDIAVIWVAFFSRCKRSCQQVDLTQLKDLKGAAVSAEKLASIKALREKGLAAKAAFYAQMAEAAAAAAAAEEGVPPTETAD